MSDNNAPTPETISAASEAVETFSTCCMSLGDSAQDLLAGLIVTAIESRTTTLERSRDAALAALTEIANLSKFHALENAIRIARDALKEAK